jgi:hypothetical protein
MIRHSGVDKRTPAMETGTQFPEAAADARAALGRHYQELVGRRLGEYAKVAYKEVNRIENDLDLNPYRHRPQQSLARDQRSGAVS